MLPPFGPHHGQDEHDSVNLDDILIEEDIHEAPSSSWQGLEAESEADRWSRRRSLDLDNRGESMTEKQVLPWPALRRTSVSVRKLSPIIGFDPQEVGSSVLTTALQKSSPQKEAYL